MKFSENWLRTFVNPLYTREQLAHALTMAGIEVENVESVASAFEKVVVAEVLSVDKHPSADRLKVCAVKVGDHQDDVLQIVCGAPNVSSGQKVPCALVGATLPGITIKKTQLRGVDSAGMLCSAKELGISDVADGLLLLPQDAPVGTDFRRYYELDDSIFTLSLTPNRADCLGVLGVAREVSAISATPLHPLRIDPVSHEIDDTLDVRIRAIDACPLYSGRIIRNIDTDVSTPLWLTQRLERSGIRSINAVVDITNYVLLETGQPMHAFNLAAITGAIQVRYASSQEKLLLLNGTEIELTEDMLVIADDYKPLALAGIMGGFESGVIPGTTDIFLESAFFEPAVISGKSFRLGFSSDSAYRFERGVDFEATRAALERATYLIQSICGGKVGAVTEMKHQLPLRLPINVRISRIQRVLGVDIPQQHIGDYFKRLGMAFSVQSGIFEVVPPAYRFDLAIEEDLIEELARIYGYDQIPAHFPRAGLMMLPASEKLRSPINFKEKLVNRDFQEVINYAFVNAEWERDLGNDDPITLKNPIASQMNVMRSTLIGGLLSNLQFNLNRKQTRVRLFEIGGCFVKDKKNEAKQIERIAGISYGDAVVEQWGLPARNIDFYDIKADVEVLCGSSAIRCERFSHPALHPGKSAQVYIDDRAVGWIGELHPHLQSKYGLQKNVVLFELSVEELLPKSLPVARELSKFPPVRRDIAIVVDNEVSVHSLLTSMHEGRSTIVTDISLFDLYRGKGMENNKKSLAFRVLLQDTEKTLTDEEADFAVLSLIKILEDKFGAILRNRSS
ncbi:MAG: phenylalanine--tRNA ligase subunit beta [Nitrosomonas sp.]|nr:phenylalanine--tRNA ligase subunit beta [Nitrosomonas sp.]